MSSGFILVDIPDTCLDCRFCVELHEGIEACCVLINNPKNRDEFREIDVSYPQEKPNKKTLYAEIGDRALGWEFNVGWNSCIDYLEVD